MSLFYYMPIFCVLLFNIQAFAHPSLQDFPDWHINPQKMCYGEYIEPPYLPEEQASLAIDISSDHLKILPTGQSRLVGNVILKQGQRHLKAHQILLTRQTQIFTDLTATGHILYTEPGLWLKGDTFYAYDREHYTLEKVQYRLYEYHARGKAERVQRRKNIICLTNPEYTTCGPLHQTWQLRADKITLDQKTGRGYAQHARLLVKKTPVFYWPSLRFPLDNRRQTGFLVPYIGHRGIASPFYFNLAPNYDLTLTPAIVPHRGINFKGEMRYLTRQYQGDISWAFMPGDKRYRAFKEDILQMTALDVQDPRLQSLRKGGVNRYAVNLNTTGSLNPYWRWHLKYQTISDANYFVDLGNTIKAVTTTHIPQEATLLYQGPDIKLSLKWQNHKILQSLCAPVKYEPYQKLPQLQMRTRDFALGSGFYTRLQGEFSYFYKKPNLLMQYQQVTGYRYHLRPTLMYKIQTVKGFLTTQVHYDCLQYDLKTQQGSQSQRQRRATPLFENDLGIKLQRFCGQYLQTLEPRLYLGHIPYRDQTHLPLFDTQFLPFDYNQLFRLNRFAGIDRLSDTTQATYTVTTRLLSPARVELFSLTLGQVHYFQAQKVKPCDTTRCPPQSFFSLERRTHTVLAAKYRWQERMMLYAHSEWRSQESLLQKLSFVAQYQNTDQVYNIGYYYLRRDLASAYTRQVYPLHQVDVSCAHKITLNWRLLGRIHYDIRFQRPTNILVGIEYQGCCSAFRFGLQQFLQPHDRLHGQCYSKGVFLQFVFKGLAQIGDSGLTNILQQAIPGYQWSNKQY